VNEIRGDARGCSLEIRRVTDDDLDAVLDVYRECEDFLALGPVPLASMEMVRSDIATSQGEGGLFCGIFATITHVAGDTHSRENASTSRGIRSAGPVRSIFGLDGRMVGVVDFVPCSFEGDPHSAFLSLLMIAAPYRNQGIGQAVVTLIEDEIRRDPQITAIFSGVQVNNPQAVRFWQQNGYRIVSEPELQGDGTTAFRLRKGRLRRRNRQLDPA
jgi:ribosomal protein S18 acetylase RimI-like enzyme